MWHTKTKNQQSVPVVDDSHSSSNSTLTVCADKRLTDLVSAALMMLLLLLLPQPSLLWSHTPCHRL